MSLYRDSPAFRAGLRTVVVGVISYFVAALAQGGEIADWHNFLWGLAGATANGLLAVLTPIEPFVGVKANDVKVPVPPASREPTSHGRGRAGA